VRASTLQAQALVLDTWGTTVVKVCTLLLPSALGVGQDSLLIPRSSSSEFSKAQSPSGPFG